MTKLLVILGVLVLVFGGVWFFVLKGGSEESAPAPASEVIVPPRTPEVHTVVYTDEGYIPGILTVQKGDLVTWRNESSQDMWTASAVHPTHEVYPGSSITFCGSGQEPVDLFDACEGKAAGETWTNQFNNAGTWGYHNHLLPSHTGRVIVE